MAVDDNIQKPKAWLGIRHLQAVMIFLAFCTRINMSLALVAMTDDTQEVSFDWSVQIQSVILSSFFWGYSVLQIPGGELAARFGGNVLITICMSINATILLLVPLAVQHGGWQVLCLFQVLEGLSQGMLFPSVHHLIGKWVPLEEQSRLGTFIYSGALLGVALQNMSAGFLASYWGWPAIFYINGSLAAIWTAVYICVGADSPGNSKIIGDEERNYIQSSLGHVGKPQKKLPTPWKSVFTSLQFISLIVVHCGQNWGYWILITQIPSYMKRVLGVDVQANGVMSAIPYLAMYLLGFPLGYMADYILKKKWLSLTASRKLSNSIGHYGPAIALIGLSYVPTGNVYIAVALLTIVVGLNVGHFTGYLLVHIDMAPNFAGTLMGITTCLANIISIIAPLAAGAIVHNETDTDQWRTLFYITSAIYIICNTFFVLFGSCEKQTWNEGSPIEDQEKNEKKITSLDFLLLPM